MSSTARISTWIPGADGAYVHVYEIIATGAVVAEAWEPCSGHSTITTGPDGNWLGQIPSRPLPPEIAAMRAGSDERIAACKTLAASRNSDAFALIQSVAPALYAASTPSGMGTCLLSADAALAALDNGDAECSCGGTFYFDRDTCATTCDRCGKAI